MTREEGLIGLSHDFPKLVKALANTTEEFDFWDDLVQNLYKESLKGKFQDYFKKTIWVHLDKQYPYCPDLEDDWGFLEGRYVINTRSTKYKADRDKMLDSPLKEYINDTKIPILEAI